MTTLPLPNLDQIDAATWALMKTATPAEQRALTKAQYRLHKGLEVVVVCGGLLIPSATSAGVVYRVSSSGECSCEARGVCWHVQVEKIITEAHAHPTMPRLIRAIEETRLPLGERLAKARAEMAELF